MGRGRMCAVVAFAIGAVFCLSSQLPAASRGGNRDLERLFEKSSFREPEAAQITRAFQMAIGAGVNEREALGLVESCAEGEFPADQVVRVLTVAAQLSLEDLPMGQFVSKVREGVSKNMEPDRIVQAAEFRAVALKKASNIFKQAVLDGFPSRDREELLPEIAEALSAGTDPERIRNILREAGKDGDSPSAIRRKLFP